MRLKLNFSNWDQEGESKFIIAIGDDATFQDLRNMIIQEFKVNSFVIKYKNYSVLSSNTIADVLISKLQAQNIHLEIHVKPEQNAPHLEKKQKINEVKQIRLNGNTNIGKNDLFQQPQNFQNLSKVQKLNDIQKPTPQQIPRQQAIQKPNLNEILTESESSEEIIQIKQVKKPVQQVKINKINDIKNGKQNVTQAQVFKIQTRQTIPDDDSSSSSEREHIQTKLKQNNTQPILKQPNKQHALNLNIMSPEQEFKKKAQGWPDFQKKFVPSVDKLPPQISDKPQLVGNQTKSKTLKESKVQQPTIKVTVKELIAQPQLIKEGDLISFRYTYLDLEVCEPKVSQLTQGKVISNDFKRLQIHKIKENEAILLNFDEIVEISLDNQQNDVEIEAPSQIPKRNENSTPHQNTRVSRFLSLHDDQFKTIGRQVNFYYSDKNYYKDDFIQQHSALNEEKFMPVKLLLNFPKIKKVIDSDSKLLEILEDFIKTNKQEEVNFVIKALDDSVGIKKKKL